MQREYYRGWSKDLGRDMEMLSFGHAGARVLVFPTSMGRFFEYEDNGMVAAVADRIESGRLQLFCVDSVDAESWYNKHADPYWRVQRHMQYERYLVNDALPLIAEKNQDPRMIVTGCSFGAYHAANFGFRHPDKVTGLVTMGGAFDMKDFVDGWYSEDLYFNNPPDYLANCTDPWKYNHMRTVLATGEWDMCWEKNERFAAVLRNKGIRHELYVWGDRSFHDWPYWRPHGKDVPGAVTTARAYLCPRLRNATLGMTKVRIVIFPGPPLLRQTTTLTFVIPSVAQRRRGLSFFRDLPCSGKPQPLPLSSRA